MKQTRWIFSILMSLVLLAVSIGNVLAAEPVPYTPSLTPRHPATNNPVSPIANAADLTGIKMPTLRAVLVAAPIDGPTGEWTLAEIQNMRLAEIELISHGVLVSTFYAPNDSWDAIRTAAAGAQFFLYRGHGVSDGNNPPNVGGLFLTSGYVSPDAIRSGLHLAKNAIVMIYGCYASGSSSEDVTLSSSEAYRRVVQYSDPFFTAGAGGYFSNWFGDAFQQFIRNLFNGKTLGNAYQTYFDYGAATVESYIRPTDPNQVLWLDKDYWDGGYKYDNAFVGLFNRTLLDLFNTTMVANPGPIVHLATPSSRAETTSIKITGTTSLIFHWSATLSLGTYPVTQDATNSVSSTWAILNTTSGMTGDQTSVTMNPTGLQNGTYSATLHLHSDTIGVNQSDQSIPFKLVVAENWNHVYLPVTVR